MFYAWFTASDFGNGKKPVAKSRTQEALVKKMFADHKAFFTAMMIDGAWVDLTTYGPGSNTEGRMVAEERTKRYIRSRKRRLDENGHDEISPSTPIQNETAPEEPDNKKSDIQQVVLSVDPTVVKAIYEFLILDVEQREAAINALTALSISAEPFKSAVGVMLEVDSELVVGFGQPQDANGEA